METIDKEGGLHYLKEVIETYNKIANSLNVIPLSPLGE